MDKDIGDNSLSSLFVHAEGASDQLTVVGEIGERWGVEIGLPAGVTRETVSEVEDEAPNMPSYIRGLTSYSADDGIVVGWAEGHEPDPQHIALVIQAWTKALFDLHAVDVRVVFAPPAGESAVLTEMRERATASRLYRDAAHQDQLESVTPDHENVIPREDK